MNGSTETDYEAINRNADRIARELGRQGLLEHE